jgi:hypothetical protein
VQFLSAMISTFVAPRVSLGDGRRIFVPIFTWFFFTERFKSVIGGAALPIFSFCFVARCGTMQQEEKYPSPENSRLFVLPKLGVDFGNWTAVIGL